MCKHGNMPVSLTPIDTRTFIQCTVKTEGPGASKRNTAIPKIRQYMKMYGSIHIHSCYKLTADMNNLHFLQG